MPDTFWFLRRRRLGRCGSWLPPWLQIDLKMTFGVDLAYFQASAQASLRTPKAALRAARTNNMWQ
jgi:hypothetical protein